MSAWTEAELAQKEDFVGRGLAGLSTGGNRIVCPSEPRTATQSEDLHSEGRHQHHARAITARVFSRNPARANGSAGHPEDSAS